MIVTMLSLAFAQSTCTGPVCYAQADCNAHGDGVTDDRSNIQDCFDNMTTATRTVILEPGDYMVTRAGGSPNCSIYLDTKEDLRAQIDGHSVLVMDPAETADTFRLLCTETDADDVTIRGVRAYGGRSSEFEHHALIYAAGGGTNLEIVDVSCEDMGGDCVYIRKGSNITVRDSHIDGHWRSGLTINPAAAGTVYDVHIRDVTFGPGNPAAASTNPVSLDLEPSNATEAVHRLDIDGIVASNVHLAYAYDSSLKNSRITRVLDVHGADGLTISDLEVSSSLDHHLVEITKSKNMRLSNVRVEREAAATGTHAAIYVAHHGSSSRSEDVELRDVSVTSPAGSSKGVELLWLNRCDVQGLTSTGFNTGLRMEAVKDCNVSNVRADAATYGIHLNSKASISEYSERVLLNNLHLDAGTAGLYVNGGVDIALCETNTYVDAGLVSVGAPGYVACD